MRRIDAICQTMRLPILKDQRTLIKNLAGGYDFHLNLFLRESGYSTLIYLLLMIDATHCGYDLYTNIP